MIVAVDSGGTKTKILASDSDGNVFFEKVVKGFGLAYDNENERIDELAECIKEIPSFDKIENIVVNLGGKNSNQLKNTLKEVCPCADIEVFRESSGVIGDIIRKKENADVIIFAGTGAIALGYGKNGYFISDGWGRDIGDEGSGYYIGLEAVKACLKAIEEDEITPFVSQITHINEPLQCSEKTDGLVSMRDEIRKGILPLERDKTAAYTRIAAEYARQGDVIALSVFEKAGKGLCDTAIRVLKKTGTLEKPVIAVCGGITNTSELWKASFEKNFAEFTDEFTLVLPKTDFAHGALMYALSK